VPLKNRSVVVFSECHVGILRQNHEVGSSIHFSLSEKVPYTIMMVSVLLHPPTSKHSLGVVTEKDNVIKTKIPGTIFLNGCTQYSKNRPEQ
jgi:hypothetical protein